MIPHEELVSRSEFKISQNNLPEHHLGQWMQDEMSIPFRFKPAYDDEFILLQVNPTFRILDANSSSPLFVFQTDTTYKFSGKHSPNYLKGIIINLMSTSVKEFNDALQNTKSSFRLGRSLTMPQSDEVEQLIEKALYADCGLLTPNTPHWKKNYYDSIISNDDLLNSLPALPLYKQFLEDQTEEQIAMSNCTNASLINDHDIKVLKQCIEFYQKCFDHLNKINLNIIRSAEAEKLFSYLNNLFTALPVLGNELTVGTIFRLSDVLPEFLHDGKVRDSKYLTYPPLETVKAKGAFNRCSGPDKTLFYASDRENATLREKKPIKGSRIIISHWHNTSGSTLFYHPLCLAPGIQNDNLNSATTAFELLNGKTYPIIIEWMQTLFSFITKEFIKESSFVQPLRFDYFFSAFFAGKNLQSKTQKSVLFKDGECVVYPSVAWNHIPTNIAILPSVIDSKFKLIYAKEYLVEDTWYDKKIPIDEYPAKLKVLRESKIISGTRIIWSDD